MGKPLFIYGDYAAGATVAMTGNASGQTAADILQANEDTFISPAATSLVITIDLGSSLAGGALAIAGEALNGVMLAIHGSSDNFASSNVELSASAALSGFTSAWRPHSTAAYRYVRLTITGATTATRIYHVAVMPIVLLPYLDDGADLGNFQTTANHLISPQGHFLGTQKVKTERKLSLHWGKVLNAAYADFEAWATACVYRPQGFFFVPDSSYSTCHFGYVDQTYSFSAPMKTGSRNIGKIPFTSRYA